MLGTDRRFPSSSFVSHASFHLLMGSTIFFIVGGFLSFVGCTRLEDCALTVFSIVLSWLGGFFCGGFTVFSNVLWWLGGFSAVLWCFFAFDGACFAAISFSAFLKVIQD
jgi:hypothetical protein